MPRRNIVGRTWSNDYNIKPRPKDRNMPTQHVATLLGATCCVRLPPCCDVLQHVGCFWLKFETGQIRVNNTQHVAKCRNTMAKRTQHVAPNNVARCCVGMLRSFGRGFTHHPAQMLHEKFDHFQSRANNSQHVATRWSNTRNMLRPTMLRHVALKCCDRLAGALHDFSLRIVFRTV